MRTKDGLCVLGAWCLVCQDHVSCYFYFYTIISISLCDTNYRNIQYTQNAALRIATGCHKMSSADHLHVEAKILKVREHSYYLHSIWLDVWNQRMSATPSPQWRPLKDGWRRLDNTVVPMRLTNDRKATFQGIHIDAVNQAVNSQERNVMLDDRPPPINNFKKDLTKKKRTTLAILRSGHCRLIGFYKSRIKKDASLNDCGKTPHDESICFLVVGKGPSGPRLSGSSHDTDTVSDLWRRPTDAIRDISYLKVRGSDWDEPD